MTIRFQRRLEALYGLERRKDKLGLDGTRALLGALGNPHTRFRSVHVAGTNGKGSTCALIERVLREAGIRTGLYTSPHLVDFRERIRVSGRWVDEAWLDAQLARIDALPEGKERTFFEVCTALAFSYFAEQRVEIAVVEVGLGGRLDCTNVITPEVSVITSIALDHTEILGDTIEQIAAEKAGIIKPNVPVVTGVWKGTGHRVIVEVAARQQAPIVSHNFRWFGRVRTTGDGPCPPEWQDPSHPGTATIAIAPGPGNIALPGMDQIIEGSPWGDRVELPANRSHPGLLNAHLALAVLAQLTLRGTRIPWPAVREGIARTRWPGRMEACPAEPRLWWDGAHNVSAAMQLGRTWLMTPKPSSLAAIVTAFSRDKDVSGFFRVLRRWRFADPVIVTAHSCSERAMHPASIAEHARSFGFQAVESTDVPTAVRRALELAGERKVLLTGSLFAIGEAMEAFGGAPGEWL